MIRCFISPKGRRVSSSGITLFGSPSLARLPESFKHQIFSMHTISPSRKPAVNFYLDTRDCNENRLEKILSTYIKIFLNVFSTPSEWWNSGVCTRTLKQLTTLRWLSLNISNIFNCVRKLRVLLHVLLPSNILTTRRFFFFGKVQGRMGVKSFILGGYRF